MTRVLVQITCDTSLMHVQGSNYKDVLHLSNNVISAALTNTWNRTAEGAMQG